MYGLISWIYRKCGFWIHLEKQTNKSRVRLLALHPMLVLHKPPVKGRWSWLVNDPRTMVLHLDLLLRPCWSGVYGWTLGFTNQRETCKPLLSFDLTLQTILRWCTHLSMSLCVCVVCLLCVPIFLVIHVGKVPTYFALSMGKGPKRRLELVNCGVQSRKNNCLDNCLD